MDKNQIITDHDLLVTLSERVKNGFEAVTSQVKELKDGTHAQLDDHEKRIQIIETIIDKVSPLESFKEFNDLKQEVRDFKTSANVFRVVAGIIGGTIVFVLTQVPGILRGWGVMK